MDYGPLVEGTPLLKGFLCGSVLAASFTLNLGFAAQALLFAVAVFIFLDSIFIFGRETHILSFILSLVTGFIAGMAFAAWGMMILYMVFVFVAIGILYLYEFTTGRSR